MASVLARRETENERHAASLASQRKQLRRALDDAFRFVELGGVLANTATIQRVSGAAAVLVGDPTEGALLVLGEKAGLTRAAVMAGREELLNIPFNSARKRMTVVTRERVDGVRVRVLRRVVPTLDRRRAVPQGLTRRRVIPAPRRQRFDVLAQLPHVRWTGQQWPHDREAKPRPLHPG